MNTKKVLLASASPRRKQLLEWANIDFEVRVPNADETVPPGLSPAEAAMVIAKTKAEIVAASAQSSDVIIAADTIVTIHKEIIGKPADRAEAIAILQKLSGQVHEVITGVCVVKMGIAITFSDSTLVEFHPLTLEQIEYYVDNYKPYDKAGAYAIQEWIGVVGIKNIHGDFYNVMGLPVSRVIRLL